MKTEKHKITTPDAESFGRSQRDNMKHITAEDVETSIHAKALKIDKHNLDQMLISQPQLFQDAGERLARAMSDMLEAKDELKTVEAEAYQNYRYKAEMNGIKVTENILAGKVQRSERRKAAYAKWLTANKEVDLLQSVSYSFQQRGRMLEMLCQLYNAGYYIRNNSKSMDADEAQRSQARAKIAEARKKHK